MSQFSFQGMIRGHSRSLRRTIRLSGLAIWAERLAAALWPAFAIICLWLAAALMGGFTLVDPVTHRVLLAVGGALLTGALILGFWRFRRPQQAEAIQRLDQGHPGRPLEAMSDTLAAGRGSTEAEAVWRAHQLRAAKEAAALRPDPPDLRLAGLDTWALRLFAPALLAVAFIGAGDAWRNNLVATAAPPPVEPLISDARAARNPAAEAWAVPPSYTGLETVYLTSQSVDTAIRLPAGSEITIRVTDLGSTPELAAPGLFGADQFSTLGTGLAEIVMELTDSGPVTVLGNGEPLASWQIEMIPDNPPEIEPELATGGQVRTTLTRAIEIDFIARDDYGVITAWGEIEPEEGIRGKGLDLEPITFALPLPISRDAREITDTVTEDLTQHPWAGAEVQLRLYAEDGAGQTGESEIVVFTLPERNFRHPLARALVEQRRELALDFEKAVRVLDVIQAVSRRPDAVFGDKHGAYLGTRMVVRRLANAIIEERVPDAAPELVDLLWEIALTLEGTGDLENALANLREAEQALSDALESGTEEEIADAIEELRQAMSEYLQELARQAMENQQAQQPGQQQQQQGQRFSEQDFQEMLEELQRQAESGLRDQARDLLSELSQMLENLQAGQQQQQQAGQGQGQQALQELQEMIQRQRDLADRTFDELRQQRRQQQQGNRGQGQRGEQGQQPAPGQRPGEGGSGQGQSPGQGERPGAEGQGGLAQQQEELRRALEELSRQMPGSEGAARALGEAERAMGEARDALEQGENSGAVEDQMEALDRLSEGAQALAESMQNGQGDVGAEGQGQDQGDARNRAETDPFDRPLSSQGGVTGNDVEVPGRAAMDRAREILDELRRRSAEQERPELELDYFERLLEQF
ncbi:MAG: TIGR02302 family protein [Pseudomonadota bacterium]